MIQLYTWPTPNGHKVQIMLEEIGLPYAVHPVDIIRGAQFDPDLSRPQSEQQGPDDRR